MKLLFTAYLFTIILTSFTDPVFCQIVKSSKKVCPDTLKMSEIAPKDTTFFQIPDTGFYKDALIEWDTYPEFPGRDEGLTNYLREHTVYPNSAIKDSIEGKVRLLLVIDPDGCPRDIKVMKGIRNDIDSECIRVIKEMPKWKPGSTIVKSKKGWYRSNSRVYYTIPFSFSMTKKSNDKGIIIYPKNNKTKHTH
jgi:TonB family protein